MASERESKNSVTVRIAQGLLWCLTQTICVRMLLCGLPVIPVFLHSSEGNTFAIR